MNQKQRDMLAGWKQSEILWNVPMAAYSTLRAGGRAEALIDIQDQVELQQLVQQFQTQQIRYRVIGRGSNILVSEQGYDGVIIRLQGKMNAITPMEGNGDPEQQNIITVGAGCSMAKLVSWCTRNCLAGLEFMVGIPGSVGGAISMNAGAWGDEIGALLREVSFIAGDGSLQKVAASGLDLSYRQFELKQGELGNGIITSATLGLTPGKEEQIRRQCNDYLERRRGKQPTGVASAGSFFKNPPNDSAGRLIEAAGLKGVSCGQAMVSPVHANFIVNTGQATAGDIVRLMKKIQETVYKQFGVMLEPEVQII